ncbi:autotransporter adhesin, partial [Burkholderia ambifaria]
SATSADAVNGSQLYATNQNVSQNATNITALDGRVTINETKISTINDTLDELSSGTAGLVQQTGAGANLTVGANTDGVAVDFTGTDGARTLTGVADGTLSATSADAVNGSQLYATNQNVSQNATNITALDGRVTTNETNITSINDTLNELSSGTAGLVQQTGAGANLTVGANTDGVAVDFTGTAGARTLTGVANGSVSATSTDAINGSQVHAAASSVADALGGGATVNADGTISQPSYSVGGTTVTNIGDALTNVDTRVTNNSTQLTQLTDQINNGSVGLVRQDAASSAILVASGVGGSVVDVSGTDGQRRITGIANGVDDDDAVTVSQMRSTLAVDLDQRMLTALQYDDVSMTSATLAGTNGTKILNLADGRIAAGSMEAVNGGQIYAMQQQFANRFDSLNGQLNDLNDRVVTIEENGGGSGGGGDTPGGSVPSPGTGTDSTAVGSGSNASGSGSSAIGSGSNASGSGSSAIGSGSNASGDNSSAVGNGSSASGSNSSAIGAGSNASGNNGTAVGQGSAAAGENSTAIGQGSSAKANNSVALGAGSVADEANTVSVGGGEAGERRITNVAAGVNATDAVNVGQLNDTVQRFDQRFADTDRAINQVAKNAYAGVAAAMAMPNLTPSGPGKTIVAAGAANYKSGSAVAAGATYRSMNGKWLMHGAVSATSTGDLGVRAQVGYEF